MSSCTNNFSSRFTERPTGKEPWLTSQLDPDYVDHTTILPLCYTLTTTKYKESLLYREYYNYQQPVLGDNIERYTKGTTVGTQSCHSLNRKDSKKFIKSMQIGTRLKRCTIVCGSCHASAHCLCVFLFCSVLFKKKKNYYFFNATINEQRNQQVTLMALLHIFCHHSDRLPGRECCKSPSHSSLAHDMTHSQRGWQRRLLCTCALKRLDLRMDKPELWLCERPTRQSNVQ